MLASAVAMAQGEPAGFGYWIGVLVKESDLAFKDEVPRDKRALFRKLARFLVENEFEHVSELRNGLQQQFCRGCMMRHCVCVVQGQIRAYGWVVVNS